MARCDFCSGKIEQGTGKKFVRKDGRVLDFCGMKCEKNMLVLKRKPHTTKWTGSFHKDKKSAKDTTKKKQVKKPAKGSKK
ncbi:MAG: 50S ribosomal protein L24e [Candidatus Woesearchaeota archaeon]